MNTDLTDRLTHLRRELTATRVLVFGLMLLLALALLGASRLVLAVVSWAVALVAFFLGCLWGLGDTQLSLRESLKVTAILVAIGGFGLWWALG